MTENKTRHYTDNQYNRTPDHELGSGFSNYERLMVELNNRQYYPKEVCENFLNENGLDAYETFDKNTDHAKLLETVYSILQTLLSIYSVIEYCTINPINGGPETNDIVLKFYAVYIVYILVLDFDLIHIS